MTRSSDFPPPLTNSAAQKAGRTRANNFNLLRLLFAALVVVSHSPEIVDGNRSRELLTRAFGTMSFGEMSVDAFFLVSGYLITMSFARSSTWRGYMLRRAARIFPGYLVASALCFFVLAPFIGATLPVLSPAGLKQFVAPALRLLPPYVPGAFAGMPYPDLDGPMWTIAYEFRCYVAVAMLGLMFRGRKGALPVLIAFVAACLVLNVMGVAAGRHLSDGVERITGSADMTIRFAGVFGAGALFYLLRDQMRLTGLGAGVAAVTLCAAMFSRWTAEPALALLGGYLIFSAAFKLPTSSASRWTDRTDLSYGLYLYAWPIGNGIAYLNRSIDPWLLCGLTLAGATASASLSWRLVEAPCLRWVHARGQRQIMSQIPEAA